MSDMMTFPATVEEFMEQYKIVDDEKVYTNGADLVPIFRMMQWLKHVSATDTISRQAAIMDAESWVAVDEYEKNLQKKVVEWLKELPPAELGTNLAEIGTDTISRQAAIDVAKGPVVMQGIRSGKSATAAAVDAVKCMIVDGLRELPPAQPAQHIDADGTLGITVTDIEQVKRVIVDENKSKFCRQFYLEEEQRTGEWIPQDHNKRAGNISTCVYYYPTCSGCGQVGNETYKYCPHCGAKMISEGKTCDSYRDGTCTGTKEIDPCSCGGVKNKCDFYEHVRREGDAE